jgi:hypothetical protein
MSTTDEETAPEAVTGLSYNDLSGSLTGYDEERITERFGIAYDRMLGHSFTRSGRALLYVHFIRGGDSEKDAWKRVMKMTIREINTAFEREDEDADEDDAENPVTEQGKDDATSD